MNKSLGLTFLAHPVYPVYLVVPDKMNVGDPESKAQSWEHGKIIIVAINMHENKMFLALSIISFCPGRFFIEQNSVILLQT